MLILTQSNFLIDCRRYLRPFFLDPKTSQPTSAKIYIDVASFLATQLIFSFTTAPFVLLTLPASFLVWARVYFYAVIATALATAFFASPGKAFWVKQLNKRTGATGPLKRTHSQESLASKEPVLGLPSEPQEDLEELVSEVRAEMEVRQRKGIKRRQTLPMPEIKTI